jgi:hypothetical protein
MLAKLRLDQTKTFEKLVGARYISEMLVSFVQGKVHPIEIGAEQGGIDKWDDFIIQVNTRLRKHIQIKRQTDRFGIELDKCERNNITRNNGNVELRDLSELDESIKSLGNWIKTGKKSNEFEREFHLEFFEGGVEIKKGFKIINLVNILETHIRPNTSTPEGIQSLCETDSNMKKCACWLKSWCDIDNFEQIYNLFKVLSIRFSNTESALNEEIKLILKSVFKASSIDEVHSKIISYTSENSTFTGAIRPRHLLFILKDHLLPEVSRWTKFQTDGRLWNISGIHDLESNNEIERPSVIVPALWASGNQNVRSLKIDGACVENCLISESLMRLSLHPQGSFNIFCTDKYSWKNSIKAKTGGTIGVAENDLNDEKLLNGLDSCNSVDAKEFTTIDEQSKLAEELHNEMYKATLKLVDSAIFNKIREMPIGDLRNEIEIRWNTWKLSLENSVESQKKLFSKMLWPKIEGESILGELRVGSKTVCLIKEALFLLLVVSVCLSDANNKDSWKSVTDKLKMTTIGLAYWSGPAVGSKKVIKIDDEAGLSKLLENEQGQIIIIPQSELTDKEVFKDDITGDMTKVGLLTHPKYPKLLITQDRIFKRELEKGNISKLKEYFQNSLDKYEKIINDAVGDAVGKVVV